MTPVRHRDQATRTSETAHPQFQAGKIALRLARSYMRVHQLGLALVCEDAPTYEESHVRRLHTLGWDITQNTV